MLRLANFTEMRFKHALACRRPNEYAPQVPPMVQTPAHGNRRATPPRCCAGADALGQLSRGDPAQILEHLVWALSCFDLALGVAFNPAPFCGVVISRSTTSAAGQKNFAHRRAAKHFVCCARAAQYNSYTFDGTQFPDPTMLQAPPLDGDFYWTEIYDVALNAFKIRPTGRRW